MEFIKQCFTEHDGVFMEKLKEIGFTPDQASQFLPLAATEISESVNNSGATKIISDLMSDGPSSMIASLNIESLAQKLGMNSDQVGSGMNAIAPALTEIMTNNSEGLVNAAASMAWGSSEGLINSTKKLFS